MPIKKQTLRAIVILAAAAVVWWAAIGAGARAATVEFGPPTIISGTFSSPTGLTINTYLHQILVANAGDNRVLYSSNYSDTMPLWAEIEHFADPIQPESLFSPGGVSADSQGNAYVVDTLRGTVELFRWNAANLIYISDPDFASSTRNTVDGKAIMRPRDIAVSPDDRVYLLDSGNDRILRADGPDDDTWEVWQQNENWGNPYGLDVAKDGAIYLADTDNHQILKLDSQGIVATYGHFGIGSGEFRYPRDVAVSTEGHLFVADTYNSRVVVLNAQGEYYRTLGGAPLFDSPQSIAVDDTDRIFIADSNRNRLIAYLGQGSTRAFDAYIRDTQADTGAEPSNVENEASSPDILIRHWPDVDPGIVGHAGLQAYQSARPYVDAENYIYLAVGNRGNQPITGMTAKLYWANPDTITSGRFLVEQKESEQNPHDPFYPLRELAFPKDWRSYGFYSSYVDFDRNHPTNSIYIPSIEPWQDFYTKKLWSKSIGDPNTNIASYVTTDVDGNLYVAGITTADHPDTPVGQGYLAKFDSNGNIAWAHEITESTRVVGIAVNVSGIYVATTSGNEPEGCGNATEHEEASHVSKFSDSGEPVWREQVDGRIEAIDAINAKIFFASTKLWCQGALYVFGSTKPLYYEASYTTLISWLEATTGTEHFLDIVPTDGGHASVHTLKVWEDTDHNIVRIFVGGDVNNGNVSLLSIGEPPPSDQEAFIMERIMTSLPNGLFEFADLRVSQFGTVGRDSIEAISIREPDRNQSRWSPTIYIAGTTEGSVQAGTLVPSDEHIGIGSTQSFLMEYEPDLTPIEQTVITEVSSNVAVNSIFVGPSGVYVAGAIGMDGQSADSRKGAFIAKYDFDRKEIWQHRDLFPDPGVATGLTVVDSGIYAIGNFAPSGSTGHPANAYLFKVTEPNPLIIGPILWHPSYVDNAPSSWDYLLMVRLVHANDPSHAGVGFVEMVENNNITVQHLNVYQGD